MAEEAAKSHHHIVPLRVYILVAAALMVLTVVTVAVSYVQLGSFNIIIALLVAALKASLVVLYFMHLRYEWNMNLVVFIAAIAFLAIFMSITMLDVAERGGTNPEKKAPIRENAKIYDDAGKLLKPEGEHGGLTADSTMAGDSLKTHDGDSLSTDSKAGDSANILSEDSTGAGD